MSVFFDGKNSSRANSSIMTRRIILLEGAISYFEGIFRDFWAVDELLVRLPDEDSDTIIVDVDVAEVATGAGKIAEVKGECMVVGGLKVVHILFEDIGGDDSAGVL